MPSALLQYPTLDQVYVRSSLLEAGVMPDLLRSGIPITDPDNATKGLVGRKAAKYARAWGPVLVHNALHDPHFPNEVATAEAFRTADSRLAAAADSDWFAAMHEAATRNVAPIPYIRSLPKARQSALLSTRRQWVGVATGVEHTISDWVRGNKTAICAYLCEHARADGVSLKKLAKFKPKAE